jgi:VanZ family protein
MRPQWRADEVLAAQRPDTIRAHTSRRTADRAQRPRAAAGRRAIANTMPTTPASMPLATDGNVLRRAFFSPRARRNWAVILAVLTLVVLGFALVPGQVERVSFGWDKTDHALAFASLAFSALYALRGRPHLHAWIVLALLALGVAIELLQSMVPGRVASVNDIAADAAGIVLGLALATALARRLERRRTPR